MAKGLVENSPSTSPPNGRSKEHVSDFENPCVSTFLTCGVLKQLGPPVVPLTVSLLGEGSPTK